MRETLRGWHQQRSAWYRTADASSAAACPCGSCGQGSAYREASSSLGKLRAFVHAPCGKQSFAELAIQSGPKSSETVEFYRRQCCRAPLPAEACSHQRAGAKAKAPCKECADCEVCGCGAATMPKCSIEHSDQADAEWKEYRPRVEPDGRSFQDELVTVKGTRKQLMERLQLLFAVCVAGDSSSPDSPEMSESSTTSLLSAASRSESPVCVSPSCNQDNSNNQVTIRIHTF